MLLEEFLNSLPYVYLITKLDIFAMCNADENFQKFKTHESMLIIVLVFLFIIISCDEICINHACVDISIINASVLHKLR